MAANKTPILLKLNGKTSLTDLRYINAKFVDA